MRLSRLLFIPTVAAIAVATLAQSVSEIEKQKQAAEKEIRETKGELTATERQVNAELASLRKIEGEIAASQKEIESVKGQIDAINGNISALESNIASEEADLRHLRDEYLKAVKKMRVARKQNSGLAFIFSSGSFNEARRRMRYMGEFAEWKDRRSDEIKGLVSSLSDQRGQLVQARKDAEVALGRQQAAKTRLSRQHQEKQQTVDQLRANSEALRAKLARRQSEAKKLSSQISALIAEQKAKEAREAEARRQAAEQKRLAEEKRKAEEKAAEERRLAEANRKAEEKKQSEPKAEKKEAKSETTSESEYAEARKRRRNQPSGTSDSESRQQQTVRPETPESATAAFEAQKGRLPKPVSGSFEIISAFGVHPISPDLPDIMDENLGIDAHVANGAGVSAVYEGEVIKVYDRTNTPGFRNIVVVKHGDYITVYANLETLSVKSGQTVRQGQQLGTAGADFDDPASGLIHFEVWKNQSHLDPASWLKI